MGSEKQDEISAPSSGFHKDFRNPCYFSEQFSQRSISLLLREGGIEAKKY